MATIKTLQNGTVGESQVDDATFNFGERMNPVVLRDAVIMYEANKRQGTVNTLTRRFVNGTHKKSVKQKHTGGARHGDRKAPLFRGGGVAHGPHPRDHGWQMPRRALKRALQIALAGKLRDGQVSTWAGAEFSSPNTKSAMAALTALGVEGSALVVAPGVVDRNLLLSVRNLRRVRALPATEVSAYDVVFHRNLVLLDGALEALVGRVAYPDASASEGNE
ncbi:MAG: 50S ribosomal protein L4 [Planctomycetota bacterium]|nr:50S ribosomal protein L4 [Planctomycetota bacterium]